VAREFLLWLAAGDDLRWLDVGAGTGALSRMIAQTTDPRQVVGCEPSDAYLAAARRSVDDRRVRFEHGDACSLRYDAEFDAVVSGLVLNFIRDVRSALRCMTRAVVPGGMVAAYVWDYRGRMQMLRSFWDAAAAVDVAAWELDEGVRFPLCDPSQLTELWRASGLRGVESTALDVVTRFRDFDDYWSPFLGGQGPAPAYLASLAEGDRVTLRDAIRASLPTAAGGSISMVARAWAVKGRTPDPTTR
jgi:SAM-dependent methyltransferase